MTSSPIVAGGEYEVFPVAHGGAPIRVRCSNVEQRNWSRVASGEYRDAGGQVQRCFIKQYLDRAGDPHRDHWEYEHDGALAAAELLDDVARIPHIRYRDNAQLLNVFDYIDVISIDILLRTDQDAYRRCIDSVISRMGKVLDALQHPPDSFDSKSLKIKQRDYGQQPSAVNFKGFEIRNAGVVPLAGAEITADELVLFDFVRPYMAPVEEAAAKLFVSIGLLNWGSPLGRFIKGPDKALLARAADILAPWLDSRAIAAELDLQEKFRTGEFKGAGGIEVFLKRVGVDLIGKYYLRALRSWCLANIS